MILQPPIIALLVGSALVTSMLLYSAYHGIRIIERWDIHSGSEIQLDLERRTYLISTLVTYALGFQLISLFLFIYTADHLAPLFVGAMCAAGSLNVNNLGYSTIILKVFDFVLAGVWLVINHIDTRAFDYPLIKKKYTLLLAIVPFVAAETIIQGSYFLRLRPNIITSCCGTLFTSEVSGAMAAIISLPQTALGIGFYASIAATFSVGAHCFARGRSACLFSISSLITFIISIIALISFISPYIYELPTHHCPFCIVQKEYGYIGYPIYFSLLIGVVSGLGTGAASTFSKVSSLVKIVPRIQRTLALVSIVSYSSFFLIVGLSIILSNLKL